MATRLLRVTTQRAADAAGAAKLAPEAMALLRPEMTPGAFVDALAAAGRMRDAIQFLAHVIGRREAVWWACTVARTTLHAASPRPETEALRLAESWVYQPAEETRWAAHAAAEAQGFESASAIAALACFFSGASLTKPLHLPAGYPPVPPVPPDPLLTARMTANVMFLASMLPDPTKAPEKLASYLARGIEIASSAPQGAR